MAAPMLAQPWVSLKKQDEALLKDDEHTLSARHV
jgi:hypothetical protein